MSEENGNGKNGNWRTWILGIIAGLILLGIAGSIVINKEFAERLGKHDAELTSLKERLIERTGSRFTREDADRLETRLRDAIARIEHRQDAIERRTAK